MSSITAADIKGLCATAMPDKAIDSLILMVESRVGDCVRENYPECEAVVILSYAVCHFVEAASGGSVTSRKSANGASVNIEQYGAGQGFRSTASGRILIALDIAGCTSKLVADTFVFTTIGDANRSTQIRGNLLT